MLLIDVNLRKQNPYMASSTGVYKFGSFSLMVSVSLIVCPSQDLLQVLANVSCYISIDLFGMFFLVYILLQNGLVSLPLFTYLFSCFLPQISCRIFFRYFGRFSFTWIVTVCFFFLRIFLIIFIRTTLIFHPASVFLFGFLWRIFILSLTTFYPAWIRSFSLVMLLC